MSIISSILVWVLESSLGRAILKILWDDLSGVLTGYIAKKKAQKEISDAAKASVEPLKKAVTGKEVDDATDSALNGT